MKMTSQDSKKVDLAVSADAAKRDSEGAGPLPRGGCAELLDDGQEEVFSRTAVELGRIEHHFSEEDGGNLAARQDRLSVEEPVIRSGLEQNPTTHGLRGQIRRGRRDDP